MNATFCIRKVHSSLVAHDQFSEMNVHVCTRKGCSSLVAPDLFSEMNALSYKERLFKSNCSSCIFRDEHPFLYQERLFKSSCSWTFFRDEHTEHTCSSVLSRETRNACSSLRSITYLLRWTHLFYCSLLCLLMGILEMNAQFCMRNGCSSVVAQELFSELNITLCSMKGCSTLVCHEHT